MKKIYVLVCVFVVVGLMTLSGCGGGEEESNAPNITSEYVNDTRTYGITAGNFNNRGFAAMCEERIYFQNPQSEFRIYSMNRDGSDMVRLNEYSSTFINVIDGFIYYLGFSGLGVPGSIYRMNTDGSDHQLVFAGSSYISITGIKVVGNQIFHTVVDSSDERTEGSGLFVMQTDGSERRRVTPRDAEVSDINVVGEYVFFVGDGGYMYRVNVDGTDKQPLNLRGGSMVVYGDRIYFIKQVNFSGLLYSANLYGGDLQQLTIESASWPMNIANEQVFFRSDRTHGLYKTNPDGSVVQILSGDYYRASFLIVLEDELFASDTISRWLFRMNHDGSNKQRVE